MALPDCDSLCSVGVGMRETWPDPTLASPLPTSSARKKMMCGALLQATAKKQRQRQ